MNGFVREQRYVVLKISDINAADITSDELTVLNTVCDKVSMSRIQRAKGLLECLVVESDWPEFNQTWTQIERRVRKEDCKHEMEWHQIAGEGKICRLCGKRDLCED
jgi:hypothetical protein